MRHLNIDIYKRLTFPSSYSTSTSPSLRPDRSYAGPLKAYKRPEQRLSDDSTTETSQTPVVQDAKNTLENTLSALDTYLQPSQGVNTASESEERLPERPVVVQGRQQTELSDTTSTGQPSERSHTEEFLHLAWELSFGWLKDHVKPTKIIGEEALLPRAKPAFSYGILGLNILVYAIGLSFRFIEGEDGPIDYFLSLAKINEAVEAGEYYRIFTSNFLHDSFMHLGLSCYALLTVATEAEAVLGNFVFLSTYLLGGAAGTVLCFLLTDTLTVGASSGIFGLIGALGAFLYKNHKVPQSSEQLMFTAGLLAFNLLLGGHKESAIDNLGHLGGLLSGIYLGLLLTPAVIRQAPAAEDSDPRGAATLSLDSRAAPKAEGSDAEDLAKVVQPEPLQSLVVLVCVMTTLSSSVAAAVLYRTGELPFPKLPFL